MKTRKTKKYLEYSAKFEAEKKIGNVKNGVRKLTVKQFKKVVAEKETNTVKKILDKQTILHSKKQKEEVFERYKEEITSNIKPGESIEFENSYWGESFGEDDDKANYHRTLSGILHDRYALHMLITSEIDSGKDRVAVLAEYGYKA